MARKFPAAAWLTAIVLAQSVLGFLYLRKTAVFNAPDEPYHFAYVAFLSQRGHLPEASGPRLFSEAIQPPLYYLSALPLYRLTQRRALPDCVRALRAQNLLYAVLNVWLIFLLIRRLCGEKTALLSAAFAAFLPQYLFIGASVSNAPLANLLATAALYGGLGILERPNSRRNIVFEGLAIGLGLLAKLTTACCAAAAIFTYAWSGRREALKTSGRAAAVAILGVFAGGWPLWRNYRLYGGIAGEHAMFHESAMHWRELGFWSVKLFESFWGLFAWMASPLPRPAYVLLAFSTLAAAAGFFLWARAHREDLRRPGMLLMFSAAVLAFAQTFYQGFLHARQPQGRYLFPALAPIAMMFALGAAELWRRAPKKLRPALAALLILGELALQLVSLRAL